MGAPLPLAHEEFDRPGTGLSGDSNVGIWPIYYFKDARTGQTVITSILEASRALMCAIVLSSLFLRVFIQLQLWHGVVFGIVRHQRIVMQVCSRGNNRIRSS